MGRGLLIIVSGLFFIFGIIQHSLSERQKSITEGSANYATGTQTEIIANSMVDLAFAQINEHPGEEDIDDFDDLDMMGGKGNVTIETDHPFAPSNPFIEQKIIKATGKFKGKEVEINAIAQRRAFSTYAYFSERERHGFYWYNFGSGTSSAFGGPMHSNGTINIAGHPYFDNPVTSPNMWKGYKGRKNEPHFNGGADFNAPYIDLPIEVPELSQAAHDGGLHFNKPIDLNFFNDKKDGKDIGKAQIKECEGAYNSNNKTCDKWGIAKEYKLSKYNGIISGDSFIQMKGTLNGNYTVHSKSSIEIMGDLNYFDDPSKKKEGDPPSDDFLGILSEGQVNVDKDAHKYDYYGPGLNEYNYDNDNKDINIQASIMALGKHHSFNGEAYNYGHHGTIKIYGGLIQYENGNLSIFYADGHSVGYSLSFTYDKRFLNRSPRGFPRSDIYDYISWKTEYK